MDRLIVLDKGRIIEAGSHSELIAGGGIYADLWNLQSGGTLSNHPEEAEVAAE
jgi:ATP-binding cassette subfamily B multidrug efflux pump